MPRKPSRRALGKHGRHPPGIDGRRGFALLLAGCLLAIHPLPAGNAGETTRASHPPLAEVQQHLEELRRLSSAQSTNAILAWQLGRACFSRAELAASDPERETLGLEGIEACRRGVRLSPTNAPAHYYLALNLGQVARTRRLSALKLVREMEAELLETCRLDERFDHAGADRALGLLYRDAPGWPVSVGSHKQARLHFRRSIALEPDYPGNRMAWAEFLVAEEDWAEVREEVRQLEALWARARERLSGPEWAPSWVEWQERLERIRSRVEQKAPPVRSPQPR